MINEAKITESYEILAGAFVRWARARPDIKAAAIIGSRARTDKPADEWADLDIIIITSSPEHYVQEADWVEHMGKSLLTFIEPTAAGEEKERRVLFEGMLDVDFAILPLDRVRHIQREKRSSALAAQLAKAFGRGMRVLIDEDNLLSDLKKTLLLSTKASAELPTEIEFLSVVNDFLYHTIWTAKHLLRGELWWADSCCNCRLSQLMLRMIEWHAKAEHGSNYDTWFRGRFLEEWTDKQTLEELKTTFAHYDKQDTRKALIAALSMFRRIATETAEKLGHQYPEEADKRIEEWLSTRV